jgi:hypothetical protein
MNEIPIAFFPPARTAEQAQNKLYDLNRFMGCIYEVIEHGFTGEPVCLSSSLFFKDRFGCYLDDVCLSGRRARHP